jgi:hypothetical protein
MKQQRAENDRSTQEEVRPFAFVQEFAFGFVLQSRLFQFFWIAQVLSFRMQCASTLQTYPLSRKTEKSSQRQRKEKEKKKAKKN